MYYKVVTMNLTSVDTGFITNNDKRITVQYKIGEWIHAPNNTRLFVFDNLFKARHFANTCSCTRKVFECSVKGGIKGHGVSYSIHDTDDFWNAFNKAISQRKKFNSSGYHLLDTPAVLVKSVKLIKEI